MQDQPPPTLRESFRALLDEADAYFALARDECKREDESSRWPSYPGADEYWNRLSEATINKAEDLISRLLPLCATLAQLARTSPLTGDEDVHDIKIAAKSMRAAFRLREYNYREARAVHDQDIVLGFQPAEQSEGGGLTPNAAEIAFDNGISVVARVLKLVEAAGLTEIPAATDPASSANKYRANTAFIMMWMAPDHPDLTDVADAIRLVFRSFGIKAVRADDIEHEGLITDRVLDEIRTSEFLFADLTGARPNVYYEVGYAHALGKRVVLFRKSGTGLHFDLAGYNCPEYENLRDLREKLTKRLISLTNRNPSAVAEI